ncbi:hypothetical protein GCM10017774_48350 [Lentzea cavernae]|uniref:Uncharacterized protein n=1 Tax=Lentzea cavernae TaxID=2020703 RepID=A0ABQ3MI46_9PSEU|nr:hypothetical protein GCM10017774_48350 [Lentzea cavernae]
MTDSVATPSGTQSGEKAPGPGCACGGGCTPARSLAPAPTPTALAPVDGDCDADSGSPRAGGCNGDADADGLRFDEMAMAKPRRANFSRLSNRWNATTIGWVPLTPRFQG